MSSSGSTVDIHDTITKFLNTRRQLKELEEKHEKYRSRILAYMLEHAQDQIEYDDTLVVKKNQVTRETVSKNDLPDQLWQQYCKTTKSIMLTVGSRKKL